MSIMDAHDVVQLGVRLKTADSFLLQWVLACMRTKRKLNFIHIHIHESEIMDILLVRSFFSFRTIVQQ